MRTIVFGYHEVGCACLRALIEMKAEIPLVVTHADEPGENIWFGSVREIADVHRIPVVVPEDVRAPGFVARIRTLRPDVLLSAYFRQILGSDLLAMPRIGAFNMHGSLLPKLRGRAPVNWALVLGEARTGVTLHHMVEKADRGDIVGQHEVPIEDEDTALTLHRKCAAAAGELLRELWPRIESGTAPRIPQDEQLASTCGRRRPEDGRIDWSRPAREIRNLVRAVTHPYPGAFTTAEGTRLFIWRASVLADPTDPAGSTGAGRSKEALWRAGTIEAIVEGRGFLVRTSEGGLLVERAQMEADDEARGDELIRRGRLIVGQRLG